MVVEIVSGLALSFTEVEILDSGDQCKTVRLNGASKYGQLYAATQTQYTGVLCNKIMGKYIFRQRQLTDSA